MQSRALATIGTGPHARLLTYSGETFSRYALKHGYEYVQGSGAMPERRPTAWAKVVLLRRLLDSFDLVLWVDADAIILDDSVDLAAVLRPDAWQALVAHEWDGETLPNTGVWMLRSTDQARRFLDAIWESREFIDATYWENGAVMKLLGYTCERPLRLIDPSSPWLEGTQWLPEEWNRVPYFTRQLEPARIRHVCAERLPLRVRTLRGELAALEGRRLWPTLARWEWAIQRGYRSHPLWFPYRAGQKAAERLRALSAT